MNIEAQLAEVRNVNEELLECYKEAKKQRDELLRRNEFLKSENAKQSEKMANQTMQLSALTTSAEKRNLEMKKKDELIRKLKAETQQPSSANDIQRRVVEQLESERTENLNLIAELRNKNRILEKELKKNEDDKFFEMGRVNTMKKQVEMEKQRNLEVQRSFEAEKEKIKEEHKKEVKDLEERLDQLRRFLSERVDQTAATRACQHLQSQLQNKEKFIELLKEKNEKIEADSNQRASLLIVSVRKLQSELEKANEEKEIILRKLNSLEQGNKQDLEDTTCLICKTDMDMNQAQFQKLPKCTSCKRRYHEDCISRWFDEKITCPVCKKDGSEMENIDHLISLSSTLQQLHL